MGHLNLSVCCITGKGIETGGALSKPNAVGRSAAIWTLSYLGVAEFAKSDRGSLTAFGMTAKYLGLRASDRLPETAPLPVLAAIPRFSPAASPISHCFAP